QRRCDRSLTDPSLANRKLPLQFVCPPQHQESRRAELRGEQHPARSSTALAGLRHGLRESAGGSPKPYLLPAVAHVKSQREFPCLGTRRRAGLPRRKSLLVHLSFLWLLFSHPLRDFSCHARHWSC